MINKLTYPCIQRFREHVQLKDLLPHTQRAYLRPVWQLANHCRQDPAELSEDQVRGFFLHLRQDRALGCPSLTRARTALRWLYTECLQVGGSWKVFGEVRIKRSHKLPLVLNRQEVAQLLKTVRAPRFRVCLRLIYHCGLRVGEAVRLEVDDLQNTRTEAPYLRVRQGKGRKDRVVPLSPAMVSELRQWWQTHRDPRWLFPSPGRGRTQGTGVPAERAMEKSSVQMAFRLACRQCRAARGVCVHTLRHCYATHLLEEGVGLRLIGQYLGHSSLDSTVIYTHLTAVSEAKARSALATLHQSLGR